MAFPALDSFAKTLDKILDHECYYCRDPPQNICSSRRLCLILDNKKQQIQSLHEKVVFLLDFIQDYPGEAANLEARFTNAAKQAEDTLRNLLWNLDYNDQERELDFQELETVMEEFESILQEATQIKRSQNQSHARASFSSKLPRPKGRETLVGFEFEKEVLEIRARLCGEPSQLQTTPIVGMGGIGKTTLARYVYDDLSTTHHFDVHAWVTVSQNSSSAILLSTVLSCIDPSSREKSLDSFESLVLLVHRYLKNRRYLIVMDDVWDTDVWDDVRRAFPDDCNGSRVVITTRSLDVASYVASSSQHHRMQLMSVDQSWRLLKDQVFGQENCPPQLERIGKIIAEKCHGLPLAIVVIAGVLSKLNKMQDSWEKIARNVSKAVNTSDEQISDILSVSYTHLPHHLRPCFLYMGCFPEDYEINVSKLIRLWAGEGFLVSSNEAKDMEELGYEYLEDLAKRSLVLIEKKCCNGEIKAVKIHDLLRDLCSRKSRDDNFLHVINEFSGTFPQGIENSLRLSVCSNVWGYFPNMDRASIQTLVIFWPHHWAFDYWKSFRFLRVLDALDVVLDYFSHEEILELIHLRYLALKMDSEPFKKRFKLRVPKSLSKLQSLQTLVIRPPYVEARISFILPDAIWKMPELRHIILVDGSLDGSLPLPWSWSWSLKSKKPSFPENLHTLSCIESFTFSKKIIDMLQNLQKLGISYSGYDIDETGWSKYGLNNLVHLHKLEKLNLYVCYSFLRSESDLAQQIAFPVSLRKVTLTGCRIPWEEMTILGSLPNLQVLKLKREACDGTTWETSEGEFCELKVLLIHNTDLRQWITESSHFPRLERLTLQECNDLEEIPMDIGEIATLELIEVDVGNLSVVQSAKCIQQEQESFGNHLQVTLIKSSN